MRLWHRQLGYIVRLKVEGAEVPGRRIIMNIPPLYNVKCTNMARGGAAVRSE